MLKTYLQRLRVFQSLVTIGGRPVNENFILIDRNNSLNILKEEAIPAEGFKIDK